MLAHTDTAFSMRQMVKVHLGLTFLNVVLLTVVPSASTSPFKCCFPQEKTTRLGATFATTWTVGTEEIEQSHRIPHQISWALLGHVIVQPVTNQLRWSMSSKPTPSGSAAGHFFVTGRLPKYWLDLVTSRYAGSKKDWKVTSWYFCAWKWMFQSYWGSLCKGSD